MEAEYLTKNLSYLDYNIYRTKNGRSNLYFFSLCDIRNEAVFLILEYSSIRGIKQKKKKRKNMKFFVSIRWAGKQALGL